MPNSENSHANEEEWQGIDRDTFLARFSDFQAARENADEARAEQRATASKPKNAPAEIPLPDFQATPDDLGMERKVPRQLHIWFAAGLGLLACVAALAQGIFNSSSNPNLKHEEKTTIPTQDSEPPLNKLQQELAHQRSDEDPSDNTSFSTSLSGQSTTTHHDIDRAVVSTGIPSQHNKKEGNHQTSREISPSDLMADLPGQLPLANKNSSDVMLRYENDKARALITGSKMLALDHSGGGTWGLANLTSGNLPLQVSSLIQSSPKIMKGLSDVMTQSTKPNLPQVSQPLTPPAPWPALSPRPHSPGALVLEGTAIPCVLLTELRSDLPGMVVAQVSEDVFDSLHADVKVIPRGARLIGRYDSHITSGQQRLLASFHRLILPNGTSVELEKMEGSHADGSSGLKGEVDTHFWARFGQAFLTAGLAHAIQPSTASAPSNGLASNIVGPNAAGQILIDTTRVDLQAKGLLQPTIMIHQGDTFVVMVNRDLALPALSNQ